MKTYIKKYLFDDCKLRDRALSEFNRGLRDGRVVAFTGSLTTEVLGYFSWSELNERFGVAAASVIENLERNYRDFLHEHQDVGVLIEAIRRHSSELKASPERVFKTDHRTHYGIIREAFDEIGDLMSTRLDFSGIAARANSGNTGNHFIDGENKLIRPLFVFERELAGNFLGRSAEGGESPLKPLIENLGITRFVTINYDLELERGLMLLANERWQLSRGRNKSAEKEFMSFVGRAEKGRPVVKDRINRLVRIMGNGLSIESDILSRERVDRLIELSVGSANVDRHILHLHGRADEPGSMVMDVRDYDALYRKDDLFKSSFEHALKVLFSGNPVLFVGVGMSEAEINATLQNFVSDNPYRRVAPAFLLWTTAAFNDDHLLRNEEKRLFRLDYLLRLGVFVIFDEDLHDDEEESLRKNLEKNRMEFAAIKGRRKLENVVSSRALKQMLEKLPITIESVQRTGERLPVQWRSLQSRMRRGEGGPCHMWGTPYLRHITNKYGFHFVASSADSKRKFRSTGKDVIHVLLERVGLSGISKAGYAVGSGSECDHVLTVGIARAGFGRGLLAAWLSISGIAGFPASWRISNASLEDRLLINAGFSYDSDAMLSGIGEFLRLRTKAAVEPYCRERFFSSGEAFKTTRQALIIINGIDRFFGFDGTALSAELDHLIRCILFRSAKNRRVQWIFLGGDRLRLYFLTLGVAVWKLRRNEICSDPLYREASSGVHSVYMRHVERRYEKRLLRVRPGAAGALKMATDSGGDVARRAFFGAHLDPAVFNDHASRMRTCGKSATDDVMEKRRRAFAIGCEILRAMAFIGWPVEAIVLLHVPGVLEVLRSASPASGCPQASTPEDIELGLKEALRELHLLGLVIEIDEFSSTSTDRQKIPPGKVFRSEVTMSKRYGLHRAVATELRERHGVYLSDAKLSCTFNMSLFATQPTNDHMPDSDFHDEIGVLVDRLIGAWHDPSGSDIGLDSSEKDLFGMDSILGLRDHPGDASYSLREFFALCSPRVSACLRAALALIRGYYSTNSLLNVSPTVRAVSSARDGALTEHSERLDRLLRGFSKVSLARDKFRKIVRAGFPSSDDGDCRRSANLLAKLGADPFYPDDLVWLHNERGVVKLLQGDLYSARRSLTLALKANEDSVEFDHRGHNWRRISMNLVGVMVERGRLRAAENILDDIDASIDGAAWAAGLSRRDLSSNDRGGTRNSGRVATIVDEYGRQDGYIDDCTSIDFTREEILISGLSVGYRGLIDQTRGRDKDAIGRYVRAISILRRLGESRAYALFQRHHASLRRFAKNSEESIRQHDLAVLTADAARQMDLSHRARILRAKAANRSPGNADNRRQALADVRSAMEYGALTDSHRVRIEASALLGRMMLDSGEFDAALKHACEALAVACRYGHSLMKIELRISIGEILIQRGDPKSGRALLDQALSLSSRIGFSAIVDRIERAARGT